MFKFLSPFRRGAFSNTDVAKSLYQKLYKSLLVLYTVPFNKGDRVFIDKYNGIVQKIDLWYIRLKSQNKFVFVPTSFIYDQPIEIDLNKK